MKALLAFVLLVAGACTTPVADDPPSTSTRASDVTTPVDTTVGTWPAPPDDLCEAYGEPIVVATVIDERLVEVSGIVRSRAHPGVTWMHNDSGDGAVVYAVDADGRTSAAYNLGVLTLDPEDLAIGPGPTGDRLYFADIGDNFAFRPVVSLYRFAEPDPAGGDMDPVERIDLVYPDGPVDAEAVAIDPVTGDVIVVTKTGSAPAQVLRGAAAELVDGAAVDLQPIATLNLGASVTAADISPTGDRIVLRGYEEVWLWPRTELELGSVFAEAPCALASPVERQGEAITIGPDGSIATVSEGANPAVFELSFR